VIAITPITKHAYNKNRYRKAEKNQIDLSLSAKIVIVV
jgi:hypothetical protein